MILSEGNLYVHCTLDNRDRSRTLKYYQCFVQCSYIIQSLHSRSMIILNLFRLSHTTRPQSLAQSVLSFDSLVREFAVAFIYFICFYLFLTIDKWKFFILNFAFKISCRSHINFKLPVQRSKSVLSLNVCQWLRRFLVTRSIFTSSILQLTLIITALFINTRILKFKSQLTFAFSLPSIILGSVLGNRSFL